MSKELILEMSRVLIFSKNPFVDQRLQSVLQRINMEVFCSSELFYQASSYKEFINHFSLMIISDTIPTVELEQPLLTLRNYQGKIFRIGKKDHVEESELAWIESAIDTWLTSESSDLEIVEKVSRIVFANTLSNRKDHDKFKFSEKNFYNFQDKLSKKEKTVLFTLYKGEGNPISRNQLCKEIWRTEVSNSQLSQLSALARRINLKSEENGFQNVIKTKWKGGYYLSDELILFFKTHQFQ